MGKSFDNNEKTSPLECAQTIESRQILTYSILCISLTDGII